jgi:hypothetical protein
VADPEIYKKGEEYSRKGGTYTTQPPPNIIKIKYFGSQFLNFTNIS